MNEETLAFIKANAGADVRRLALQAGRPAGVDIPFALDQIAGRQAARRKLPSWAAVEGLVYPPHLSMEQCSGEAAARYKAGVARRLCGGLGRLVDITGGFGVDFSFLAPMFDKAVYIERQSHLCDLSRHNMAALGITQAETICGDCAQIIGEISHVTLIYADPARRSASGGRTFAISDCTPDVLAMKETLLDKADFTMLKLSPMLDWRKAAADMGCHVGEVHIVSAGNECKELLLIMSRKFTGLERIYCVNDDQTFSFAPSQTSQSSQFSHPSQSSLPSLFSQSSYLYEPNASLMKAGCFALIAQRYACRPVSRDSHLFLSSEPIPSFPGRGFAIRAITTMNKRELKAALGGTGRANVSVRNFPMTADALRKKLKLKDGGDTYIFGTTTADSRHVLIICEKHHYNQTIQS